FMVQQNLREWYLKMCAPCLHLSWMGTTFVLWRMGRPEAGRAIPCWDHIRLISENPSTSPKVEVSIVEVYNNDIVDLLAKDSFAVVPGVKREMMTAKDGRKEVAHLTCEAVGSAAELMRLVRGGLQLRAKHPTLVHADSSRSHLIVTVTVTTARCSDGS
ncbi:kinesin-like protein KIF25 isoform 2, partial [Daubentonia madagascariensis]